MWRWLVEMGGLHSIGSRLEVRRRGSLRGRGQGKEWGVVEVEVVELIETVGRPEGITWSKVLSSY